jgi:glucose/arabinose dehydrogenase
MWTIILAVACGASPSPNPQCLPIEGAPQTFGTLKVVQVAKGCGQITDLQFAPDSGELYVASKDGQSFWLNFSTKTSGSLPTRDVQTRSEMGLLGLAFAPDFATSRRVFVNENPSGVKQTRIGRWTLSVDGHNIDGDHTVLTIDQPYANHDAGQLAFGPDGMLYVGMGDGGSGGDPHNHGQNRGTLLGSMLRIDVSGDGYSVPPDNPFVGEPGVREEIWAYGLRNPWRYSFEGNQLVVADVGQNLWEEISVVSRGANMGWKQREGRVCFSPETGCASEGLVDPIHVYGRQQGQSITGGYVAGKGSQAGRYLFADFASGRIWSMDLKQPDQVLELGRFPGNIASFGRDTSGNVYFGDFGTGDIFLVK